MAVSGVTSTTTTASTTTSSSTADAASASLNYDSFLKLLVAQMKNQDPTEPMDSSEQIAQLATFSQVEQTIKTNTNLESLLARTSLSEANAVIGKTVTSADGETTGVVKEVKLYSDGIIAVLENGDELVVGAGVTISDS
ncbi:flagellar hook assembly protein FlgD [Pararhizobium sp. A13]|uniref:flagellar hook assembly protein FlgD n=1 Tax=Pararhizobium sp. A13 TaxID=3133975 RepID=UPI003248BA09